MRNNNAISAAILLLASCAVVCGEPPTRPAGRPDAAARESDYAARKMLEKAKDLLLANEQERGIKLIETLLDQYPKSPIRYQAYLALGKHYIDTRQQQKAINALRNLKDLEKKEAELGPDDK